MRFINKVSDSFCEAASQQLQRRGESPYRRENSVLLARSLLRAIIRNGQKIDRRVRLSPKGLKPAERRAAIRLWRQRRRKIIKFPPSEDSLSFSPTTHAALGSFPTFANFLNYIRKRLARPPANPLYLYRSNGKLNLLYLLKAIVILYQRARARRERQRASSPPEK